MIWLVLLIMCPAVEMAFYGSLSPAGSWEFLLGMQYLATALAGQCIVSFAEKKDLRVRSISLLACLLLWADLVDYLVWQFIFLMPDGLSRMQWLVMSNSATVGVFVVMFPLSMLVIARDYSKVDDPINHDNVMLLFLRPTTVFGTIISFVGGPVCSICVLAGGRVWAFSHQKNKFVTRQYNDRWANTHCVVDTGVPVTDETINRLGSLLGSKRGWLGVRCVYILRGVLDSLGDKWRVKTPLELIPGVYALKASKWRQRQNFGEK